MTIRKNVRQETKETSILTDNFGRGPGNRGEKFNTFYDILIKIHISRM